MRGIYEIVLPDAAASLRSVHWNGTGCSSDPQSSSNCSNCFGPSPMSSDEVVKHVFDFIAPYLESEMKTTIESALRHERSLHDGPIWKAAIDRCIEILHKEKGLEL